MSFVLAIDQGTTNTKAIQVNEAGQIVARAASALSTTYPQNGWAEQSASAIWESVLAVIADIVAQKGDAGIAAIAIANQRETLVTWDAATSQPIHPAIIWQCRRTADTCASLIAAGHDAAVVAATGLGINPLFPASKLGWVMAHVRRAQTLADFRQAPWMRGCCGRRAGGRRDGLCSTWASDAAGTDPAHAV